MTSSNNGNSRPLRVIRGASIAHRRLTPQQSAVEAADVYAGRVILQPTLQQAAQIFGVSVPLIERALKLSPDVAAWVKMYGSHPAMRPTATQKPHAGVRLVACR
jgi:hypothetical protein